MNHVNFSLIVNFLTKIVEHGKWWEKHVDT